jgi:glutamate synthase (NADPH/NADH) small chain
VGNYIPEWNDFMFRGNWKASFELMDSTNNLPEVTGRVCPAVCEYSCVLGLNDDPVTIRENELAIIEHAFKNGLIKPKKALCETKRRVAIVGSGPAGLSCAMQLCRGGHSVTVFERDEAPGGILRFGIPDFKLEKFILDRRIALMRQEGVEFKTGVEVGRDLAVDKLKQDFDAICLAGGSRVPRNLDIEGRETKGIYFAMDYLMQSNRRQAGVKLKKEELIDAKGKKVVVIGGGDTGSDCVGTANRQGASCVVQLEVLPKPQECRTASCPWPQYPLLLKVSSSHEEGAQRQWSVETKRFVAQDGELKKLICQSKDKQFEIEADMAILAMGFLHPEHKGLLEALKPEFDPRGNVLTGSDYMTSVKGVFCAGDMRRGQSLVVWAVSEGRNAAFYIDRFLKGGEL